MLRSAASLIESPPAFDTAKTRTRGCNARLRGIHPTELRTLAKERLDVRHQFGYHPRLDLEMSRICNDLSLAMSFMPIALRYLRRLVPLILLSSRARSRQVFNCQTKGCNIYFDANN